jgi:hypothetical protein
MAKARLLHHLVPKVHTNNFVESLRDWGKGSNQSLIVLIKPVVGTQPTTHRLGQFFTFGKMRIRS